MKYDYDEILRRDDLNQIIINATTFAEIMRNLCLPVRGKMGSTLKKKLLSAGYNLNHLTGIPKTKKNKKTLEEYLLKGTTIKSCKLKNLLLKHGLKQNKCEICGIETWNNQPLIMQLHHIDGDSTNNTLENLQMICPNCHSQTDNYCGKNINIVNKIQKVYICPVCGGEKRTKNSECCFECRKKLSRGCDVPSKDELKQYVLRGLSNENIGKIYNVSRTTIKRWKLRYDL